MADFVRYFTCASIIALGGAAATTGTIGCSSDSATTPAGDDDDDDDDDTKGDAGGKQTSSSSSSGDSGAKQTTCAPLGTWSLEKPTSTVLDEGPTGGKVCKDFAANNNANAAATEVTITALADGNFKAKSGPSEIVMTSADNVCELGGGIAEQGFQTVDADNKDIIAKVVKPTQRYGFNGNKITSKLTFKVESDPPGAKGTDCFMEQTAPGTKK